jgi:uncharacterized protein
MHIEIQADNLGRAAEFYGKVLGWEVEQAGEDLPVEYWRLHSAGPRPENNIAGGLLPRQGQSPSPGQGTNAFVCSFEVASFDETAKAIKAQGGQVALPKFPVPGRCWQGYFLDTEGNTFGIYEIDESAG